MLRDPLSAVIGMHSTAEILLRPLLVLIRICVALKLLLSLRPTAQSRGPHMHGTWRTPTLLSTLTMKPTLSDTFSDQIMCSKVLRDQS